MGGGRWNRQPGAGWRAPGSGSARAGHSQAGFWAEDGINQQHSHIAAVKKCAKKFINSAILCNIYECFRFMNYLDFKKQWWASDEIIALLQSVENKGIIVIATFYFNGALISFIQCNRS